MTTASPDTIAITAHQTEEVQRAKASAATALHFVSRFVPAKGGS